MSSTTSCVISSMASATSFSGGLKCVKVGMRCVLRNLWRRRSSLSALPSSLMCAVYVSMARRAAKAVMVRMLSAGSSVEYPAML